MRTLRRMLPGILVPFFSLLMAACRPVGALAPETTPAPPPIATALPAEVQPSLVIPPKLPTTPSPNPLPGGAETPTRTKVRIEAAVDFAAGTVAAAETLRFANPAPTGTDEVLLLVGAQRLPDVFTLEVLRWGDGSAVAHWTLSGGVLEIGLPEGTNEGEILTLELEYTLDLPARPGKTSYYDRQLNLGDWYAAPAVYNAERGWLVHPAHPVGETLVYGTADFSIRLRYENAPQGLVVASSAPCEEVNSALACEGKAMRSFAVSMSPAYQVLEEQVGDVTVRSYFFPEQAEAGAMALQAAAWSIELFSELFGPYPHSTYSVLPANFLDGLEFDGLAYVGGEYYGWFEGGVQNYLYLLTVHEAAHQWWYALVGNDQATEPWLDEALATYSELLYIERYHPVLRDWWWALRVDLYRPLGGNVGDPVYAYSSFRPYVNAVYLRGADFLEAVRTAMGDEDFLAALRTYADAHRGGLATGSDLLRTFENRSGADLTLLFERYFAPPQ